MELKNLQESWDSFPEVSMEERPVLSSDLEQIVVRNPLSDAFYLKNKILFRIIIGSLLLLYNIYHLRALYRYGGPDMDQQVLLFFLLAYFVYFHIRLLLFADYPTLLGLQLIPFLQKIETIMDKYIFSFGILSVLSGFYTLMLFGKVFYFSRGGSSPVLLENGVYKWLIIIFLSVSFYILFLHTLIPKYKKLLEAVRKYKVGIGARPQKK
ncbi:MAG: hypothetical protein BGO55_01665 [Sphingobacteriales bacterium 50-39]|nr:hypothetical protein [Sphingobacteriales bacterium]OJW53813.1 MAG: hypothetical protein BGO55_01665 [Sphingobacteriales bacterium 50-39]